MPPFWVSFSKQRKKPGLRRSTNYVQNAFFQLSPSGRNEKTPLVSNFTISVSWHHFGWAYPRSGKSRIDEGRPIAFKTRFFNFPHPGETKKHPWDRILQFRFHATILGGLYQAAEKAGFTKVDQLRSKRVFSTFPIGAKRKNTLGIEFYKFGFMPPFWVSFSKQRKKPGLRRSTNYVQNAFFQLSPSGRNEKTPLGSNFTISVSCHHFGWALPSSGKSRVYECRPIAFKTRFFNFPHRGETRKHPWDRILQFRFHATILGGLLQAAEKTGFTKVVQLRSKRVFSTFPIGAKRENTPGIEFYNFGFMAQFRVGFSKQRKKPDWRRSSNCVQNAFFQLSPSERNEKTNFGSNFTISVSCHHFGWALPSSGKSRVHEGGPIAFKTRFFNFPHRGETKKHPWDRILQFRFHATILGGLFQAAEKAGLTKVVQLRSKRVFSTFPIGAKQKKHNWDRILQFRFHATILGGFLEAAEEAGCTKVVQLRSKCVFSTFPVGAKRKNTLGIEFYNFGFMAQFRVGFSKQRKKAGSRRSSNCVQNAFFQLCQSGRSEKTALGLNFTISVSCHHFGWAFPSSAKRWGNEGRRIPFKTRFFNFPHRGEAKKQPWDRIYQFWFYTTILGGLFQAAQKAGLTKVVQMRSKRVFSTFTIGAKRRNTLGIDFTNFDFIPPFWVGFCKQCKKPGWRRSSNCVQNAFFSSFPIGAKRKNTLGIEFHEVGFIPPFWVGFYKQCKKPGWRRSFIRLFPSERNEKTPLGSNFKISVSCHHFGWAFPSSAKRWGNEGRRIPFKTRFFDFPHRGEAKKQPWDRIYQFWFYTTILGGLFQAAQKAGLTKVVQMRSKRVFSTFTIGAKRRNTLGIDFTNFDFIPPFWVGFCKQCKKPGWRRSSNCVQNAFFSSFPIGAKRKNTLGIEFHEVGFIPPFWVGFYKQCKKPGWRRSFIRLFPSERNEKTPLGSNFKISVSCHHFGWAFPSSAKRWGNEGRRIPFKTRFFDFPHRGEAKKQPWDRIYQFWFYTTILGGLFQAAQKAGLTKVVQMRSKRVFSTFPIGAKRRNTLGIDFTNFDFIPPFWVGFCKQCKKPGWRRSSNCVQNAFFRVSPSGRNEKTPLGSNSTRLVSYHHFGWAFTSSAKSRVDGGRLFDFSHRSETRKHPWDRIPRSRFHTTILGGLFRESENAGLTKVVQLRSKLVFSSFHIWAKRKNTLGIEFHEVGFIQPFWVGFCKQRKMPDWRRSSNCVQNSFFPVSPSGRNEKTPLGSNSKRSVPYHHFGLASFYKQCKKAGWRRSFFRLSPSGRNEKTPLGSNSTRSVSYHHFWWAFASSVKSRFDEGRPIPFKTRFFDFPHHGETKNHPWNRIYQFRFHTTILVGFPKHRKKPGWRRSSDCVQKSLIRLSPSGGIEKTPLGSNSTRSVS